MVPLKWRFVQWIVLGALGAGLFLPSAQGARRVKVDGIKVVVNSKVITQREFIQLLRLRKVQHQRAQADKQQKDPLPTNLSQQVLQQVVENLLLESHAEQLQLRVEESKLDEQVDRIYRSNPQIENEMSETDLKTIIYRDLLRRQVITQQVDYRILVSQADVDHACTKQSGGGKELDIGHILLRNISAKEAKERLVQLRKRVLSGENFEALASAFSQDPSAAANRGRLGFVARGELVDAFEKVAFDMEVGQVSDAVKTQFGWHLIKVFAVRHGQRTNCKQLTQPQYQRFYTQVYQQQHQQRLDALLKRLKKHADIVIF